ncbi:hypothetical protein F5Y05DRAFT_415138 [Hypoxylon sp. FL0543]|nr:hypothetical protein F5Y05DRAFT_415138 [Hypoxylon sp. FL0543]
MAPFGSNQIEPCRFFNTAQGCLKGESCRYSHAAPDVNEAENDGLFEKWRKLVPQATGGRPPCWGSKLPQYFHGAYALVLSDAETLQKTIKLLAMDQGIQAIEELIDERIPSSNTDSERAILWRNCIRPFFQLLTEPRVASSTILEVHTGSIYTVVFGENASRLEILFNFLIELAAKWQAPLVGENDGPKSEFLELSAVI